MLDLRASFQLRAAVALRKQKKDFCISFTYMDSHSFHQHFLHRPYGAVLLSLTQHPAESRDIGALVGKKILNP